MQTSPIDIELQQACGRQFHPLANIFPLLEGEEFEQLVESIRASNGPREPIIVYEGLILDGRNRARACDAAGIASSFFKPFEGDDPVAFVIDKNLRRRHLNESQRGMVASKLATWALGDNQNTVGYANLQTRAEAAALLNVSERTVASAAKVRKEGTAELVAAVEQGEIAVSAAEKIARLPIEEQSSAVEKALPNGARAVMASRKQPVEDLDYSPTPPWATRALIERVFPALNISRASLTSMHEPACGEGHMAEVLREYFPTVVATDIHDYGYGDAVQDFLDDKFEVDADWIVTNPPFNKKAEQFALKAIAQARVGVAILAQLRWLETIGRYERLFRDHPPTVIAFFAERVALHMGKWVPDGSTATAYIWLVWVKGMAPRAPIWIPPDPGKILWRPDDVKRFTASPVINKEYAARPIPPLASTPSTLPDDDLPAFLRRGDPANAWLT
jgi:hypothetical protein